MQCCCVFITPLTYLLASMACSRVVPQLYVHAFGRTDVLLYATAAFTSVTAVITSNAYKYDTYTYIIDYITWNYKLKFLSLHA